VLEAGNKNWFWYPDCLDPSPARHHFVLVKLILIFNEIERGAATLKAINLVSR